MIMIMFGYLIFSIIYYYVFISPFSPYSVHVVLVMIEKIYETLKTVFDYVPKKIEIHEKYSTGFCILNSLSSLMYIVNYYITKKTTEHNW